MTVYLRSKSGDEYFSTKEAKPDKTKMDALKAIEADMPPEVAQGMREQYEKEAQDGDPQEPTWAVLEAITRRYEHLSPMAKECMESRIAAVVAMLNTTPEALTAADKALPEKERPVDAMDKHIMQARKSSGASWAVLRGWCDEVNPVTGKKTGKPLVPAAVARALDVKVEEVKAASQAAKDRKAARAANEAA